MATIVTYPYIMAKVRLQAKYEDVADDESSNLAEQGAHDQSKLSKKKERYSGALDVLRKVAMEKGLAGWYQVCPIFIT